jgi:hypothetical protein
MSNRWLPDVAALEVWGEMGYHSRMSEQGSDDDQIAQRRDAILRRLLTTPPKSRAELAEELRRAKREKATRDRAKRASAEKREGAA